MYSILIYYSETNYLGQVSSLNDQLGDVQKRFTYFVPRDFAWKRLAIDNPSAYNKLFTPGYANIVSIIVYNNIFHSSGWLSHFLRNTYSECLLYSKVIFVKLVCFSCVGSSGFGTPFDHCGQSIYNGRFKERSQ